MDRRSFLRRSTIAVAGGLLLGDAALEAFERLTHRKVFALGGLPQAGMVGLFDITTSASVHRLSSATYQNWRFESLYGGMTISTPLTRYRGPRRLM